MVELVDTYALGAYALRCAGSNPVPGTITEQNSVSSRESAFFIAERRSAIKNRPVGEKNQNCRDLVRLYDTARNYYATNLY